MEYYLPFDIQAQILQRLPAKSLIRFTCVCKPWNSLIHNSKFIRDYHVIHRTHAHSPLLLRYTHREDYSEDKYVSIIDDDTFPENKFSFAGPISVKKPRQSLLGSSQGLFCFYQSDNSQFVLWNPTIKKAVAIDLPSATNELYKLSDDYRTKIGFGVCPNTLDAKLVHITYKWEIPLTVIQVEVYTLSSRAWRILASINLPQNLLLCHTSVDVDGFIYWLAWDKVSGSDLIMSFSLTSEVFTEVYLQDHITGNNNGLSLSKLGESLVVLENNDGDYEEW